MDLPTKKRVYILLTNYLPNLIKRRAKKSICQLNYFHGLPIAIFLFFFRWFQMSYKIIQKLYNLNHSFIFGVKGEMSIEFAKLSFVFECFIFISHKI